jgi:hypothetical protein
LGNRQDPKFAKAGAAGPFIHGVADSLALRAAALYTPAMNELVFEVTQEADGGLVAECLSEPIFTQAENWAELRRNVQEAVAAFFFDQTQPGSIRLHLVRDELLATA